VLFAAAAALGGAGAFTAVIVVRLGLLSVVWSIALVAVCKIAQSASPRPRGVVNDEHRLN
jgi:putative effector of murein hydrolase